MYLISACLAGINCRYDGASTVNAEIVKLMQEGRAIVLCPEVLGGLEIPRESCEIIHENGKKKIVGKSGQDYTDAFLHGAEITLEICKSAGIDKAVLQERSPSCGCGYIYDGSFSGRIISGNGITAALLEENGIEVVTVSDFSKNR